VADEEQAALQAQLVLHVGDAHGVQGQPRSGQVQLGGVHAGLDTGHVQRVQQLGERGGGQLGHRQPICGCWYVPSWSSWAMSGSLRITYAAPSWPNASTPAGLFLRRNRRAASMVAPYSMRAGQASWSTAASDTRMDRTRLFTAATM